MKLHLPLSLLSAVLLATASLYSRAQAVDIPLVLESGQELNLTGNTGGLQSPLILSDGILSIDYSNATTPASLNGNALSLSGGTALHLIPGTATDGRVINLLTNVGTLYGTDGTPLVLNEQNNAAANYFDTTQPGTGYWANATLQLTEDGTLQMVRYTDVSIPEDYTVVEVNSAEDIVNHSGGNNVAFRLTEDVTISGRKEHLSTSNILFTSDSPENIVSIAFKEHTHTGGHGGVFYNESTIAIMNFSKVHFEEAIVNADAGVSGGAIYGGNITINNNGSVTFRELSALSYGASGGAIAGCSINLSNNGSVIFCDNSTSATELYTIGATTYSSGGAIFDSDVIKMEDNSHVVFNGNSVTVEGNDTYAYAGAIDAGATTLHNNAHVIFQNNSATASAIIGDSAFESYYYGYALSHGGAIESRSISSETTLNNNGHVEFRGNSVTSRIMSAESVWDAYNDGLCSADARGGAVHIWGHLGGDGILQLHNNKSVSFCENSASASVVNNFHIGSTLTYAYGGAIYGCVTLINNDNVEFINNSTTASGTSNSGSDIVSYAYGGAIYGRHNTITISSNSSVTFSGNSVEATGNNRSHVYGGAIYIAGNLSIRNNEAVLFEKNAEITNGTYRLRSIYADSSIDKVISLSASEGKNIEIRDSIYIGSNSKVELNADYTDSDSRTHKQTGDIIFTGAYTEAHLMEMKGGIAGTAEEILASRTSEVYATTNLYGGRLRVEDGAIYKGWGITVHEGSAATLILKNGELNHVGYDITISSGSTLSVLGESTITAANLIIQDGGTMQLALDMSQTDSAAVLTTTGNLSMNNISFNLTGTEYLVKGDYKLLTRTEGVDYDISGWTLNGVTSEQLRWEDGTLYYTGGHDWNHGVTDDDDISDLEEILGNLIINGGDVTLEAVVGAIQDAVDAGFGHGQGHIVINRGGIHISGAGDLDGHIIFNGNLKAIRKLFIEKDITGITIELGGNSQAENIVDIGDGHTMEIDSLSGEGGMNKTGQGEMVVHGNGHKVGGTLRVQEGTLTFTVANDTSGEAADTETEVHELVVGNKKDKEAKVKVDKDTKVKGNKMQVDGQHAVVTNNGTMEFTEEVKVKNGHLDNQGSISKVTLEGGKVSGSGIFAGLEMLGGELVVGNSPGLQTYTDDVELTEGEVTFSLADTETAATADTHGWGAAAYSTIDMGENALTLGENVNFVLEIGGAALESLVAADGASLTFSLSLIQNIGAESLTLDSNALAALLGNTIIMITSDAEGLSAGTLYLAGRDITALLSDGSYGYEGNTLVFKGTVTNDGSLTVPEPTTATLSLLALAVLVGRRRRR